MIRHLGFANLFAAIFLIAVGTASGAEPTPDKPLAERPYRTVFATSLDRIYAACDIIFQSVERPDLSKSMSERLKSFRDFAGIDRTRPIGLMSPWDPSAQADIVFVPLGEIQELLQTATFGVVGFHQVAPDHYEIERPSSEINKPGPPYHVFIRKDYAFFADSLPSIRAIRVSPDQLTRGLRERYDIVLDMDLTQVPRPTKAKFVADLRSQIEPWLQPQDDEAAESANLRRTLGVLVLDVVERVLLDTKRLTIGGRLDPETRQFRLEAIVEAVSKSPMANGLNRMSHHRSEFASLIQPDVPVGVAFNLPISGFVERILGKPSDDPPTQRPQLDAALQLAGTGIGDLSLIAALHGPDASELNDAIPQLILKLEKSGYVVSVRENFEIHRGVVLHSLTPRLLPTAITQWIGSDVEIIIGQNRQTVWIGMGQPAPLLKRLTEAIDLVDEPSTTPAAGPLVRARFQAKKLPELVASDLLVPNSDAAREVFSRGEDGFNLTIEPVPDGLKLRIEFEEGFVRLIGRGLISQIENP